MQTEESKTEVLVNGNFATGDLTGWMTVDPSGFFVMQDTESRFNCVLRSQPGPRPDALRQRLPDLPGTYQVAVWYRSCNETGQPADAATNFTVTILYQLEGSLRAYSAVCEAKREWDKFTHEFQLPRNAEYVQFAIQNLDDPLYRLMFPDLRSTSGQVDVAVCDVSFWKM